MSGTLAPFFRLYERVSGRTGKTYLAGRIGQAKVVAFRGEADDGTPTWEVFLDAEGSKERPAAPRPEPPRQRPAPRPAPRQQVAAWTAAQGAPPAADDVPFDDSIPF